VKVSVVTPNYNMASYLPQTIESVLGNLEAGDEYFVIDGGSKDGSVEVLRGYRDKLTGWMSEPDRGYADAIAKGFAHARNDILCWINCGDLLLEGALDAAREQIARSGADMIFGDDFYIDEDGCVIKYSRGYVSDLRSAMLYGGWTPLQDACFWRRDLYQWVGGMNVGLRYAADYDLFLRMVLRGRAQYVPLAFSAFRRHAGQKSVVGTQEYERERAMVRQRELEREPGSPLAKTLFGLWQGGALRLRVHVVQRLWQRPDLTGRAIQELCCGAYWPREAKQA
jgi:glycosyltransferase involved in cell wall biosynthesis